MKTMFRAPIPASRLKKLLYADQYDDFRPGIDIVVHDSEQGGRCFIRDTQGLKADQEVITDRLDDAAIQKLAATPAEQIGMKAQAVKTSPYLSAEGRRQRLEVLSAAWKRCLGGATFVVVP